jgi:glycosyltransferase involved in cell wall biosynthesis
MTPESPLISVIVPAYNAAEFLADALQCIQDQLYPKLEVIVVDDGSTDETPRIAAAFGDRVRYVRQENQGPASARNHGLRVAQGTLIAFLDADDLWLPHTLKLLASFLADQPPTGIVLGRMQYMRQVRGAGGQARFEPFARPCVTLSLDAGLFRRSVFDQVGFFDPTVRSSEDIDWFLRAREAGIPIGFLDQVVLLYRRHDRNLTRDRAASHRDFARALKRSLDRRRKSRRAESLPALLGTEAKTRT